MGDLGGEARRDAQSTKPTALEREGRCCQRRDACASKAGRTAKTIEMTPKVASTAVTETHEASR